MKVGDTVWIFDGNRRIYRETGGPVYREHFVAEQVVGETKTSWLLNGGLKVIKATGILRPPDRNGFFGLGPRVFLSEEAVNDECYLNDHKYELSRLVLNCRDAAVLRAVEDLLKAKE